MVEAVTEEVLDSAVYFVKLNPGHTVEWGMAAAKRQFAEDHELDYDQVTARRLRNENHVFGGISVVCTERA